MGGGFTVECVSVVAAALEWICECERNGGVRGRGGGEGGGEEKWGERGGRRERERKNRGRIEREKRVRAGGGAEKRVSVWGEQGGRERGLTGTFSLKYCRQ